MFAIIVPVLILPAIFTLIYLEHKALKAPAVAPGDREGHIGKLNIAPGEDALSVEEVDPMYKAPLITRVKNGFYEIDALGLIILGFGWALVSLHKSAILGPTAANIVLHSCCCHSHLSPMPATDTETAL